MVHNVCNFLHESNNRSGTCVVSTVIRFIQEDFKKGGSKLVPLPLKYQQTTQSKKQSDINMENLIKSGIFKPVYSNSKLKLINRVIQLEEITSGNHFGETGNFLQNISEELELQTKKPSFNSEREFLSIRQWFI